MRAGFNHDAIFQYDNPVGVQHGGQAMRDRDDGSAASRPFESFLDFVFGFAVECAGGFIQEEDRRVLQQRACDPDPLLFAA